MRGEIEDLQAVIVEQGAILNALDDVEEPEDKIPLAKMRFLVRAARDKLQDLEGRLSALESQAPTLGQRVSDLEDLSEQARTAIQNLMARVEALEGGGS